MKKLLSNKSLRKIILPLLKIAKFDIHIRHHWTSDKFKLNTYLHKGYWVYGKNREKETLELYKSIIQKGQSIIEVGGHIGYFSLFFAKLVGDNGRVHVFEPGINNLPYIRHNTKKFSNIVLVEKAVGDQNKSKISFYMDNITGQNNSVVKDFEGLKANMAYAMDKDAAVTDTQVEMVSIDHYCKTQNLEPQFIKIDVEGFEYEVVLGLEKTLLNHPIIMVEVQSKQHLIYDYFKEKGYKLFNIQRQSIDREYLENCSVQNIFCLHGTKHKDIIDKLF